MKDLLKKYSKRRCCLVIKEADLIKVLDILDSKRLSRHITIEKSDSDRWYIIFNATKRAWDNLVINLEDNHITDVWIPTKDNFGEVFYQEI